MTGFDQVRDWLDDAPHVDVQPGQYPPVSKPERDEFPGVKVAADNQLVVSVRTDISGVLHAELVLVGEEVRQPSVSGSVAEHAPSRDEWLVHCGGPVLDTQLTP